jgi:radical SAM protein with 4Fe4S-binding SPASM domain
LGHIVLAVDGVTKETYERIRIGSSFERVIDNVHTFFSLKRQLRASGLFVTMQFVKMPENEHEADAFVSAWSGFDCVALVKPATNLLSPDRKIIANHPYCHRLWHTLLVTPEGTILPCVANHFSCRFPLGNVLSETIEKAWTSERLRFLRKEIVKGRANSPLCRTCNVTPIRPEDRMELLRSVLFDSGSYLKMAAVLGYRRPVQTFSHSGQEPPRHSGPASSDG